jgi:hypothetical protein
VNRLMAVVLGLLALGAICASAQDESATGRPRIIVPGLGPSGVPASSPGDSATAPDTTPPDAGSAPGDSDLGPLEETAPPPRSPSVVPLGGAVQVGVLGTVEGPVAGTLGGAEGLGSEEWMGSDRAVIETMLTDVPAATPSDTARFLLRHVLLTAAPPPDGRADHPFNALRIAKLLEAGLTDDAADLAEQVDAPNNPQILRAQADAFLYAGRDDDACGDKTARRLNSAEPFWVELRAYCYAVSGDSGPLDLTRSVITEQGLADPAFVAMLDRLVSGKPLVPEAFPILDSLHIRMMAKLDLPFDAQVATGMGLTPSLIAAASDATPIGLRIAAAEMALRAGALPTMLLAKILDLSKFAPTDLFGAPARARGEPLMSALARLRAALRNAKTASERAEIAHTAFEIGEREGLLFQVALLFGDDAAVILPDPDWADWSDLMTRGLLLAGHPEAAARWFNLLLTAQPNSDLTDQLQLALSVAAPNFTAAEVTREVLANLADAASPQAPPPAGAALSPYGQSDDQSGQFNPGASAPYPPPSPPPRPSATVLARATLDLGLFDATGRAMPSGATDVVPVLMKQQLAGRRPPPALMARIDKASLAGSKGELALAVAMALGQNGARDLAPDIVVRLARALKTAGMLPAAEELAVEALLLRPGGGVNG